MQLLETRSYEYRPIAGNAADTARYGIIHGDAWCDARLSHVHLRVLMYLGTAKRYAWRDMSQSSARTRIAGSDRDAPWVGIATRQLCEWGYIDRNPAFPELCRIRLGSA